MHRNATNAVRPPSLVDTLAAGFRALNRALPALVVPLALNAWYWLGPLISIQPFLDSLRAAFGPTAWQLLRSRIDPSLLPPQPVDLKLIGRIEGQLPFWQRVYILEPMVPPPQVFDRAVWPVGGLLTLLGTVVLLNLVLTLLTTLYLLPLADMVRGGAPRPGWLRRIGRAWLSQVGVLGLVLAFLIVVGVPLAALAGFVAGISPGLGNFLAVLTMALLLWVIFTASFAYDAVLLHGAGPIGAMLASLLVIRTSFWSAIGLYLLSFFILAGLHIIWQGLMGSIPGLIVAILSSAYIGSGLAAAHLVFYRDRLPRPAAHESGTRA